MKKRRHVGEREGGMQEGERVEEALRERQRERETERERKSDISGRKHGGTA